MHALFLILNNIFSFSLFRMMAFSPRLYIYDYYSLDCGKCTNGTTNLAPNYLKDCAGVCNGNFAFDSTGLCSSANTLAPTATPNVLSPTSAPLLSTPFPSSAPTNGLNDRQYRVFSQQGSYT
jgi:hypothetical protein